MTSALSQTPWPVFRRTARTVVVVDLVESVRLYERDEEGTVRHWQGFVHEVVTELLPHHGGRLVKSLGDGLLLEFESVQSAIQCSIAMQATVAAANTGRAPEHCLWLRTGAHVGDVFGDAFDIHGKAVNLAARLTTLAGPGEIVVSTDIRNGLTDGLDATVEDLGDCYLRHLEQPVRAYRLGPAGSEPVIPLPQRDRVELRPAIAIIPFVCRTRDPQYEPLGDAMADEVIAGLSRSGQIAVISRLSTAPFRERAESLERLGSLLGAAYVLSGAFHVSGQRLTVHAELAEVRNGCTLWAGVIRGGVQDPFSGEGQMVQELVEHVADAMLQRELDRSRTLPLPSLESYTLMLGAVTLMHRCTTQSDFDRASEMLRQLADRHRRHAAPHAWLAKWHVLRAVQGWSPDPEADVRAALDCVNRALDRHPNNALAMTMLGQVHGYLRKDPATAAHYYEQALAANPNEPLAWLYTSTAHAWRGRPAEGIVAGERALQLSPLDPLRYYFDTLVSVAHNVAGNYDEAIRLCRRSLRANRAHTATYRGLAIAQALSGRLDDARATVRQLLQLEPQFTLRLHALRYPGRSDAHAEVFAKALAAAGVPP